MSFIAHLGTSFTHMLVKCAIAYRRDGGGCRLRLTTSYTPTYCVIRRRLAESVLSSSSKKKTKQQRRRRSSVTRIMRDSTGYVEGRVHVAEEIGGDHEKGRGGDELAIDTGGNSTGIALSSGRSNSSSSSKEATSSVRANSRSIGRDSKTSVGGGCLQKGKTGTSSDGITSPPLASSTNSSDPRGTRDSTEGRTRWVGVSLSR